MTTTRQILLIDDDGDIREIAQLTFELVAGWDVLTASCGRDGLELAADQQPDAILLDVMMPGMDGRTIYARLQAHPRTRTIPVVLLTARAGDTEAVQLRALGVAGVLTKPFDPVTLPAAVADLVGWRP